MASEPIWWKVKVFHEKSSSCTHLSKYANNPDEIRQSLEEEYEDANSWVFVSAEPEISNLLTHA